MASAFLSDLARRIWSSEDFRRERSALHSASVLQNLTNAPATTAPAEAAVQKLVQAATILADSENPEHRQAAYQVAVDTLMLFGEQLPRLPDLLHVVFGKLGNFPAVDHLYRLLGRDRQYAIPPGAIHELLQHESANMVSVAGHDVVLTDFQHALWGDLETEAVVSVSAPTSAGKSFALQQYLVSALLEGHIAYVLYLVPTRALIHQVSDGLSRVLSRESDDVLVATIPQTPAELGMDRGVFVLTQERAHVLLEADRALRFEMVVVDEAQTIGEGARGILLQVVMEKLVRTCPRARFFFSSPFSGNPEHFGYLFPSPIRPLKERVSPVSQNLIFADMVSGSADRLALSLCSSAGQNPIKLADVTLGHEVQGDEPTFAYLSVKGGVKVWRWAGE